MKITNTFFYVQNTNLDKLHKIVDNQKTYSNNTIKSLPSFGESGDKQACVDNKKFQQYKKAIQYAEKINHSRPLIFQDLDKLEGIQYGIKVFDGVSLKQIALLWENLHAICTSRTCSNGCVHCYAEAKPFHVKKDDNLTITKMSWEDFSDLTDGFKQLADRLKMAPYVMYSGYKESIAPFVDADCMEIVLKDKAGNEYDMIDISKKIRKDLNENTLFDTSGWTHKDEKTQARAQKYVNYIKKQSAEKKYDLRCNISLNPFHKLNSKYVEYIKSDLQRAKKFRELYTDRMANVFYTFTPVFDMTDVINRALDNDFNIDISYKADAHKNLIMEIRDKLEKKYKNDSSFSKDDIQMALEKFDRLTGSIITEELGITGRLKKLLDKNENNERLLYTKKLNEKNRIHPEKIMSNRCKEAGAFLVDANGRVYATDEYNTVPTDIRLNFNNKNKETPPFYGLIDRVVTTEELFEDI